MAILAVDACSGPFDLACQLTGVVQSAASEYVLGGLGSAFVTAAAQVGELTLAALNATTAIDLGAAWFSSNVAVIAAITLPALVALFVFQVIGSVLRREPGGLVRAVVGVGKALLGAALALAVTQLALTAVDELCSFIASSAGTTDGGAAARFFDFVRLSAFSPALQILIGLGLIVGFLLVWGVLLFRKAALILVAVFAPIAFAGSAWDQTRVWTRRWVEIVAALVFCKLVIVVVFVVGGSAFSGTGPVVDGSVVDGAAGTGSAAGLSDMLVGLLLLAIAMFAPWLTFRFVHWSGMEAATVMHQTVAANPISRTAHSAASTTRFAAQHVALSAVTGGVGAAAHGGAAAGGAARGGAAASGAARGSVAASAAGPRPPANPPRPGSGGSA